MMLTWYVKTWLFISCTHHNSIQVSDRLPAGVFTSHHLNHSALNVQQSGYGVYMAGYPGFFRSAPGLISRFLKPGYDVYMH